ncbi:DUF4214 domain-containing protein [Mycolicibacterium iranicum]|uniref:DUF4214 domain-containing protein n=1 Tax=Mycolicibacterium iranicum TaxID=912594 RepID=A0A178LRT6_MYCIR|nr:DUF4214 domain-containing protein [Mycolicibacterium iranicum]OAN36417.1 hypothetical protein A4X20_24810 [Mycolicibacterium iranicum]
MNKAMSVKSTMHARYIGRVGGLAVLLGVGVAVATGVAAGVADADTGSDTTSVSQSKSDHEAPSRRTDESVAGSPAGANGQDAKDSEDRRDASHSTDGEDSRGADGSEDAEDTEGAAGEDLADVRADTGVTVAADEDEPAGVETTSKTSGDAEISAVDGNPAAEHSAAPRVHAEDARTTADVDIPPSDAIVTGLFREILREDPTAEELTRYSTLLNWFGTRAVVANLYNSTPFREDQVESYYLELLGRTPSTSEMALGTFLLKIGVPETRVVARVAGSDEFYQESGGTADSFVNLLYRSVLGQAADPDEADVYVQQLQAGWSTRWVASRFLASDPYREVKIQESYSIVLGRSATAAEVDAYLDSWFFRGGQAGIAKSLLYSDENIARVLSTAGIPLPDLVAVTQLKQLLMAPYTEDEDGFVRLFNTLIQWTPTGDSCAPQQVCNTALYELLRSGGLTRGIPNESIDINPITAEASWLLPTQNEIGVDNSLGFPLTHADTLAQYLAGGTVLAGSVILTANDGTYIVDGHHRWSSLYVINPYAQISAVDLGYVPNAQGALKETQLAIGAQLGYLPVQQIQGPNLFTIGRPEFDAAVERLINSGSDPAAVMKVFKDVKKLDDMAAVQDYLWANVLRMREFNRPVAGATGRGYMPQPTDLQITFHIMEGGGLIYTLPTLAYLG